MMKKKIVLAGAVLILLALIGGIFLTTKTGAKTIDQRLKLANKYLSEGKYEEAIIEYEKILQIEPKNVEVRVSLAEVYVKTEELEKAQAVLREAVEIEQKETELSMEVRSELTELYIETGKLKEAEELLNETIEIFPKSIDLNKLIIEVIQEQYGYEEGEKEKIQVAKRVGTESYQKEFKEYLPKKPEFTKETGDYYEEISIEIIDKEYGSIYYTLDGTEPTNKSKRYKDKISLSEGQTVIKAVRVIEGNLMSEVTSEKYRVILPDVEIPQISLEPGKYNEEKTVYFDNIRSNEKVIYTLDGKDPLKYGEEYKDGIILKAGNYIIRAVKEACTKSNKIRRSREKQFGFIIEYEKFDGSTVEDGKYCAKIINTDYQGGELRGLKFKKEVKYFFIWSYLEKAEVNFGTESEPYYHVSALEYYKRNYPVIVDDGNEEYRVPIQSLDYLIDGSKEEFLSNIENSLIEPMEIYGYKNLSDETFSIEMDKKCEVILNGEKIGQADQPTNVSVDNFMKDVDSRINEQRSIWNSFILTIKNNKIIKVEEIYRP